MHKWSLLIVLCLALPVASQAAQPASIGDLGTSLSTLRDNCASMAKSAADKYAAVNYQASLDQQAAVNQAKLDAQVYGVGHGSRETRDFLIDHLQSATEGYDTATKAASDKFASAKNDVSQCVQAAQATGKQQYATFKSDKKNKNHLSEAESLMAAWLANVEEISTDQPQGSDATSAQWKTAKAHAELDAI